MEEVPVEVKIECPDTDGTWPQSLEWSDLPTGSRTPVSEKTESQSGSTEVTENALPIRGTKEDDSNCDEACPQPVFVAIKEEPIEGMGDEELRESNFCHSPYAQEFSGGDSQCSHVECSPSNCNLQIASSSTQSPSDNTINEEEVAHTSSSKGCVDKQSLGGRGTQPSGHKEILFEKETHLSSSLRSSTDGKYIKCSLCGKALKTKQALNYHMRTHTGEKPYKCSQCGECFKQSSHLTTHMHKHTGNQPFLCPHCGKSFSEIGNLNSHMRTHTGERPFKCLQCGKSFTTSSNLTVHMHKHTGHQPYRCSQCGKSFTQSGTLTKHMRSHTGDRPYKCSQCGKSFSESGTLTSHMRLHTGERPYKCSQCEKSFTENSTLTRHIRLHTGEKPYKCSQCGKSFTRNSHLTKHKESHTE